MQWADRGTRYSYETSLHVCAYSSQQDREGTLERDRFDSCSRHTCMYVAPILSVCHVLWERFNKGWAPACIDRPHWYNLMQMHDFNSKKIPTCFCSFP